MRNNIVSLDQIRQIRQLENEDSLSYQAKILTMSKLELLEEMVRFQEERTRAGKLTPEMLVEGKHLFQALEKNAETDSLRLLARSYRRHLELELKQYIHTGKISAADE